MSEPACDSRRHAGLRDGDVANGEVKFAADAEAPNKHTRWAPEVVPRDAANEADGADELHPEVGPAQAARMPVRPNRKGLRNPLQRSTASGFSRRSRETHCVATLAH
jgi:hypothetical protein